MLHKALHTFFAFALLASATPGFALVCERPCAMNKSQRLACVKACALAKDSSRAEIGKPDCTRLQIQSAPVFSGFCPSQDLMPAQGQALANPSYAAAAPQDAGFAPALRGPPFELPAQVSLATPSQNAPPVLN